MENIPIKFAFSLIFSAPSPANMIGDFRSFIQPLQYCNVDGYSIAR
jgi:hypothetical protein